MSGDGGVKPGDVLAGKYRVDRVLGEGGMGIVVAAHHLQLDEKVALKFLLPDALRSPNAVARFTREARTAARIKSDHVARVTDVGVLDGGAPYMVMEYLEGGDLAGWLTERGPLPVDLAVDFVLQACVGVADAHVRGVVHRDLKPANLFCVRRSDGELTIKVLDFGISKIAEEGTGPGALTKTASMMGTPYYMSPEQIRSAKWVDARTDVWALGVILFELLAGRVPFDAESPMELAVKISAEPTPSIRLLRPEVPLALEAAVAMCLEKELAQRYANVAELAQAIAPFGTRRAQALTERTSGILGSAVVPLGQSDGGSTPALGGTLGATGRTASTAKKGSSIWLLSLVAIVALGGSFVLVRSLASRHLDGAAAGSSVQSPPPPSAAVPPSATQASPSAASAPSAAEAAPSAAVATAAAGAYPTPSGYTGASPGAHPSRPTSTARPASSPAASAPAKVAPSVDCTVPYVVDATGHHIYKPECN